MNKENSILTVIAIFISSVIIGFISALIFVSIFCEKYEYTPCVKLKQPEFLNEKINDSILLKALTYYEIKEPLIVLAQAKLESANYKSRLFKEKNNLFGLYNSRANQYYNFDHWSNCILAYKNMIEYRCKDGEDYYHFLTRIRYAEDERYIEKIKLIVNNLPP